MKRPAALAIGFLLACIIAALKGADLTSTIVVGLFYTVPMLFGLILPPWGPGSAAVVVLAVMVLAGPSVPRDHQDAVIASWAWLWVWTSFGVAITVGWTWIDLKRKARKAKQAEPSAE